MPRLSHFSMQIRAAEYIDRAPNEAQSCGQCEQLTVKTQWKRCDKGGFFVRSTGTCKHFSQRREGATQ